MSIESNSKDRDILNLIDQRNGEVEKLFEDKLKAQITELRGSKISKYDVYNRLKLWACESIMGNLKEEKPTKSESSS